MYNQEEGQSLFTNNNVPTKEESNTFDDLPPELDEIKSLNDATVLVAPTKNALDAPVSFFSQSLKQDKLDEYENNVNNSNISNDNNSYDVNQSNVSEMLPNSFESLNNTVSSSDTNNVSINIDSYEKPELNVEQKIINKPLNSSNILDLGLKESAEKLSEVIPEVKEQIKDAYQQPVSEIEEKASLTEDNDVKEYSIINDTKLSESEDNFEKEIEISNDSITSEDIIDIDEESNSANVVEESIEEVKQVVDKLNSRGISAKIEEFDFESIHQIIVIIEK